MKPEVVVDTPERLASLFAARFAADAAAAIAARGLFSVALPGGSVAESFFPLLAASPSIDWSRIDFFWGDERAVGPDDPDSNYGLAQRLLLDKVGVDAKRVHRLKGETPDLDAAARAYEAEMVAALGEPPRIDWMVLGMGPEGHVCSLFPGHALLRERRRRVAEITDSPKPPPRRVTFTIGTLELARTTVVAAFGDSKAEAAREAIEDASSQLPVALALRAAERSLVMLDAAAASRLSRR